MIEALNAGFENLHGIKWVHGCANIDWTLLTDARVDVINFDAYQYSDKAALYATEFDHFLDAGGMIGWGVVPVIEDILKNENVSSLVQKLEDGVAGFLEKNVGEEKRALASWVLPSCETVMLTDEQSDHVFRMTRQISDFMKKKYGFK